MCGGKIFHFLLFFCLEGEMETAQMTEDFVGEQANLEGLFQNVFLFNITADPYERNDLSKVCHHRLLSPSNCLTLDSWGV